MPNAAQPHSFLITDFLGNVVIDYRPSYSSEWWTNVCSQPHLPPVTCASERLLAVIAQLEAVILLSAHTRPSRRAR
jgi:hypothetical protein